MPEVRLAVGDPDVDIAYQWLVFFEEDDAKLRQIHDDYRAGKLLSGEIKNILIDRINAFLPELDKMMGDGLVTLEKIRIIRYRGTAPT